MPTVGFDFNSCDKTMLPAKFSKLVYEEDFSPRLSHIDLSYNYLPFVL